MYCREHCISLESIKGQVIRHTCDNSRCIEPTHLLVGSYKDNTRDMMERKRCHVGANHVISSLTQEQVDTIRQRYVWRCPVNGGNVLAREYGVAKSVISNVVNGRTYVA